MFLSEHRSITAADGPLARWLFHSVLLALAAAGIIVLLPVVLPATGMVNVVLGLGVILVASVLALSVLARRGYVRATTYGLCGALHLVVSAAVYSFGGSDRSAGYFLVVVVAALLLDGRGLALFTLLSALTASLLFALERLGLLPTTLPATPLASVIALNSGLILGAVLLRWGMLRLDTTYRLVREREQRLQRTVAELERRRAAEEIARRKAEQTIHSRSTFLAYMAHELRTPLNAIDDMARLLRETTLTPQQQEYLDVLQTGSQALLAIVNDILDYSKMEADRLQLEIQPFHLLQCIDEAASLLRPQATAKALSFAVCLAQDVPHTILGDATRLRQVLINLLANAVKFTERGAVSLSVSYAVTPQGGELAFAVADTGLGITPDLQPILFQPFTQAARSITQRNGGTGLGLAICKRLVTMMGGAIWIESEAGKGSTFRFTLPVQAVANQAVVDEARERPSFDPELGRRHPLRILVVEDNVINQVVATRFLERFGYQADVASSGLEALTALQEKTYDLVFMDVQMPHLDGPETARRIRAAHEHQPAPRIIAMTAHTVHEELERLVADMDDILLKPLRLERLSQVLRESIPLGAPGQPADALGAQD